MQRSTAGLRARALERSDIALADWKAIAFCPARGTVLELGAGTGINVSYLGAASELVLAEPNESFHAQLKRTGAMVASYPAERIGRATESVDVVVCSLVLCSVADVAAALAEIHRVLRPAGTLRFVEHVAAPQGTALRRAQDILQPLCRRLDGGCRPNRDIESEVRGSAFAVTWLTRFSRNIGTPLARHFVAGVAQKHSNGALA